MEGRDQQQKGRSGGRHSILDAAMDLAEGMSLPLSVVWAAIKKWIDQGLG